MNTIPIFETIKLSGLKISTQNVEETKKIYRDIFVGKEYFFETENDKPLILDCGAHIGLSVLYFKTLYPLAQIIAFEPNPDSFQLLTLNIQQNNLTNIQPINAAVSEKDGSAELIISNETKTPWTWGDAIVKNPWQSPDTIKTIKVKTERLSKYINQNIDLIKLDIEGSETVVMNEIKNKLTRVHHIMMEFHGNSLNETNNLEQIVELLEENSFTYTIKQEGKLVEIKDIKRNDPHWLIIWAKK